MSRRRNTLRPRVENLKVYILDSKGRGFDGDSLIKVAIRELRQNGHKIIYNREKCSYFLIN